MTYKANIETETVQNNNFRKVLYTGNHMQLVVMSLNVGEEIGLEVHDNVDQFFRVEHGEAKFIIDKKKEYVVKKEEIFIVPQGTLHNIINNSKKEKLKLYTIYTPPNHPDGLIHKDKAEADEYEKNHH